MAIRRTRISRFVPKATNIVSEYVIPIAFPPQQWLHERASLLRSTFIARLVYNCNMFPKFNELLKCGEGIQLDPGILHRCALPSHRTCISIIQPHLCTVHKQLRNPPPAPTHTHTTICLFFSTDGDPPQLGGGRPYLKRSYF